MSSLWDANATTLEPQNLEKIQQSGYSKENVVANRNRMMRGDWIPTMTYKHLLRFAVKVAWGMRYLSSQKVSN